jgi:N4-gp56 family major capsid protein
MANSYTTTSAVSNVVQTAYDRLLEFNLRSQPLFRSFVTKRPAQQAMPGSSVVFQKYNDLAVATTALTETVDPDAVALGNTSTVTVTLAEYGNAGLVTAKLEALALTDVDPALANIISYNCADSIDVLVQNVVAGGTQVLGTSGTNSATISQAPTVSAIPTSSLISSAAVRYSVAQMRSSNVQPTRGMLYGVTIHPKVSVDLRQETGAAAWRDPHVYSAPDAVWSGEIGQYEGCFFVENPRVANTQSGSGAGGTQTRVFNTYFMGDQVLAEAVGYEPQIVIGPVVDKLMRHRPIGWKALLGWSIYRQEALWTLKTSSSIQPTA